MEGQPVTLFYFSAKLVQNVSLCYFSAKLVLNVFFILFFSKTGSKWKEGRKEMFYLTTHSTHFIYGYMASDVQNGRPGCNFIKFFNKTGSECIFYFIFQQNWFRMEGQPVTREFLLMTLADVDSILIRATYTDTTDEAA